jgi:hypothetical protein
MFELGWVLDSLSMFYFFQPRRQTVDLSVVLRRNRAYSWAIFDLLRRLSTVCAGIGIFLSRQDVPKHTLFL